MSIAFSQSQQRPSACAAPCLVVGVYEERMLTSAAADVDEASNGALKRLLDMGDVTGKSGQTLMLFSLPGLASPRVLVVGLGEQKKFNAARYAKACADAAKALKTAPATSATSYLPEVDVPGKDLYWKVRIAAVASDAQAYRYTATLKAPNKNGELTALEFGVGGDGGAALQQATAIADGVRLARELGNLPPNICTPAYVAEQAKLIAAEHADVTLEVLETAEMEKLGMGALLGVARGSFNTPRLIVLRYQGAGGDAPYVMVGKGITFDTGGISLKPGAGMEEMKFDMCGGAAVLGAFLATAKLRLPLNLICIVPAVENMPDGNAYRPSDVVTTMSGQTVEVLNTDAEGRLILCDALTYARRFEPKILIDVATLTGACVVALGKHAHGLMSKDDELAGELLNAGENALDRAWRLPLWDDYQQQLETGFADFANIGGKYAGAITAGCFLARFTEGLRWAHLDVAGTAWEEGRKGSATGRPVGLLVQYLLDRVAAEGLGTRA